MNKRMAGDYEVIHAFHIGDKEIVIGENIEADDDERYMCAFCEKNEIMERYSDVIASDDFCEVAKLYADRLSEQAEKTRQATFTPKFQGIDTTPLTETDCTPITADDYIKGKLIVIKQDSLRQEYRMATHQLKICTGGFGSHARSVAPPASAWIFTADSIPGLNGKMSLESYQKNSFPSGQS